MSTNRRSEDLLAEVRELADVADEWRNKVPQIDDEEQATKVQDFITRLTEVKKSADAAKADEKRPHLDANKEIEARYAPIVRMIEACLEPLKLLREGYADRKRKAQREAAEAARKEADRLAEEAWQKAQQAACARSISANVEAAEFTKLAEAAALVADRAAAVRAHVTGTGGGRSSAFRVSWYAKMSSYPLACRHYANHPKVIEVLESLASAEARSGVREIPGFNVLSREIFA